jgi:hypothetical protein
MHIFRLVRKPVKIPNLPFFPGEEALFNRDDLLRGKPRLLKTFLAWRRSALVVFVFFAAICLVYNFFFEGFPILVTLFAMNYRGLEKGLSRESSRDEICEKFEMYKERTFGSPLAFFQERSRSPRPRSIPDSWPRSWTNTRRHRSPGC